MKKTKKILLPIFALLVSVVVLGQSEVNAISSNVCIKTETTAAIGNATCTTTSASTLASKIESVVKAISGLVGAFAVGMIVYGGFKYITSVGDPRQAESAKNIIWYSGVGLFIVVFAYFIFDLLIKAM